MYKLCALLRLTPGGDPNNPSHYMCSDRSTQQLYTCGFIKTPERIQLMSRCSYGFLPTQEWFERSEKADTETEEETATTRQAAR